MVLKILSLTVFLMLIFNTATYNQRLFQQLDKLYILLALILSSLVLVKFVGANHFTEFVYGIFDNRNPLAWFIAACSVVVAYKFIAQKPGYYLAGIFIVLVSVLWLLGSRAGLVAVVAGVVFTFLQVYRWSFKAIAGVMVGVTILFACLAYVDSFQGLVARADSHRFEIYHNAFSAITLNLKTFFIGHGIATSSVNYLADGTFVTHWHNVYLNVLFYTGFIGLVCFVNCFFYRFWLLFKKKSAFLCMGCCCFCIGYCLFI